MTRRSMKRVLVAVDGSDPSLQAVRYAAAVLPADRTKIVLFHVLNPLPESFWDGRREPWFLRRWMAFRLRETRQEEMIEEFMERASALLQEAGYPARNVLVRVQERHVGVARDILREAGKGYAALVLGRHGATPLKDLVLGSTVDRVVHRVSRVAVWVVGERPDPGKILIAMDRSDQAVRTLDYVTGYLGLTNKDLFLFHALRQAEGERPPKRSALPPVRFLDWLARVRTETARCEEEMMRAMFERRIKTLERVGADARRIRTRIVRGVASRAGAVLDEADREGCGTIVIGRKGVSVVKEFPLGRVASKVLDMGRRHAVWIV